MSLRLPRLHSVRRRKVLFGVYGVVLLQAPNTGDISGAAGAPFFDAIYLSAETFSTVGFGDLAPSGAIRFLCGTEALTGFILITWSASFLFLEMQQFWRKEVSGGT